VPPIKTRKLPNTPIALTPNTLSGEERTDVAFLLGLGGGLLMVVLPLTQVQIYNGPPCGSATGCPTIPESVSIEFLVAGLVDLFAGIAAIVTSSMLKIRHPRRSAPYGWLLVSLAIVYTSSLIISTIVSTSYQGVAGLAIDNFLGPLLVLGGGWLTLRKKGRCLS
jgi:hypothetical protein